MTKQNDDMVLYEVLSPEKIAALVGEKKNEKKKEKPPEAEAPQQDESGQVQASPDTEPRGEGSAPAAIGSEAASDEPSAQAESPAEADGSVQAEAPAEEDGPPKTRQVITVRFQPGGKGYFFDPGSTAIQTGDGVIVETARGLEFGDVVQGCHSVLEAQLKLPLKPIIRVATRQDREQRDKYRAREKEAFAICAQKILDHKLDMKLVNVEYAFTGAKIIFYFTADGRVDFRELVKDLAAVFKTRIELRQIGVRDEAKLLGGLGSCGRPVCCKQFLPDFQPVSIKMAKEQNLSLSPTKISGICGRLMCCLKYEQDTYEAMRKRMPRVGQEMLSPEGQGTVMENNIITEKTRLRMVLPDGTIDARWFPFEELSKTDAPRIEPAPRPPKVERLSRREKLLQEQKARALAAAGNAEAAPSAAAPEAAPAAPAEGKRKRSRRSRKRRPASQERQAPQGQRE